MVQKFEPTQIPRIEDVTRQFEDWRKTSKLHEPIPAELWKAAASLCETHRPYIIARKLRLNYTKLKEHANALKTDLHVQKAPSAAFIELDFGAPAIDRQCIIEMQNPKGGKMTLQFIGAQCPDPIEICKVFWNQRP